MANNDELLVRREGAVVTLVLNRPASRNALTPSLLSALATALRQISTDEKVRALIIAGQGDDFCVGGDVKEMAKSRPQATGAVDTDPAAIAIPRLIGQMPKSTIARIEGAAAGGGLSIALACDLRIATPTAKLATAFARIGLSGDLGGSYFLPRIVGHAKARELYLLNPILSGTQAFELDLVTQLAEPNSIVDRVDELAAQLANGPTLAFSYMKANLDQAFSIPLADMLALEADRHARCKNTRDHREAANAFVERRKPMFEGR